MAFKAENTGTVAWKKVLDSSGEWVANLDEQTNGWKLFRRNSIEEISPTIFSSSPKAISWLNKNAEVLDEV